MKKIVRLTESDLVRLVKKVINEQGDPNAKIISHLTKLGFVEDMGRIRDKVVKSGDDAKVFTNEKNSKKVIITKGNVFDLYWDGSRFLFRDKKTYDDFIRMNPLFAPKPTTVSDSDYNFKIYDDLGETKLLNSVSVKGEPKKVGEDKTLEAQASMGGENGLLRVSCFMDPPKFYFHKGSKVVLAGYNTKVGELFCSKFGIKYKGPQKPEIY